MHPTAPIRAPGLPQDLELRTLPPATIAMTRTAPLNQHSGIYDIIFTPESERLRPELEGKTLACTICLLDRRRKCLGHRLGIALPYYYIYHGLAKELVKILNALCLEYNDVAPWDRGFSGCGRLRSPHKPGNTGLSVFQKCDKKVPVTCQHCSAESRAGRKFLAAPSKGEKPTGSLYVEIAAEGTATVKAVPLVGLLNYLTLQPGWEAGMADLAAAGFNLDIRHLVTNVMPLLPAHLRPVSEWGGKNYDTETYLKVVECLRSAPNYPHPEDMETIVCTQARVDGGKYQWRGGRPVTKAQASAWNMAAQFLAAHANTRPNQGNNETAFTQIGSKRGYIRMGITGARASNTARAPQAPLGAGDRLGESVFSSYVRRLATVEAVNKYTASDLRGLAAAGLLMAIKKAGGGRFERYVPGIKVDLGDRVLRYLMPGDPLILNRQPTLHTPSLTSHTAKMEDAPIMRVHPCMTAPYNADFDGDEGNVHAPWDENARLELTTVAHSVNGIMGPGQPSIAPLFHEVGAGHMLSTLARDAAEPGQAALYLAAYARERDWEERAESYPARWARAWAEEEEETARLWADGKVDHIRWRPAGEPPAPGAEVVRYGDALGLLFPADFAYGAAGDLDRPKIRRGVYLGGLLTKATLGATTGSITHEIATGYPKKRAAMFVSDVVRVCSVYLAGAPASLDPANMMAPAHWHAEVRATIAESAAGLEEALEAHARAPSAIEAGRTARQVATTAEEVTTRLLNKAKVPVVGAKDRDSDAPHSRETRLAGTRRVLNVMSESGARGDPGKFVSLAGNIGQQFVGPDRVRAHEIPWIRNPRMTGLPQTPLANGFLETSFVRGLTPEQLAVHTFPVRFQVMRAKLEVADAGYAAKIMAMVLSQIRVGADLSLLLGNRVLAWDPAGWLDSKSLRADVDGAGRKRATFINMRLLAAQVGARLEKKARGGEG
jgi:hypothetical protein